MIDNKIELGSVARDKITGFEGAVVAVTQWLTGCLRYGLEPMELHEKKPIEAQWFDEDRLLVTKSAETAAKPGLTSSEKSEPANAMIGGPQIDPAKPHGGLNC